MVSRQRSKGKLPEGNRSALRGAEVPIIEPRHRLQNTAVAMTCQQRVDIIALRRKVVFDGHHPERPFREGKGVQDLEFAAFGVDRGIVDDLRASRSSSRSFSEIVVTS